MASLPLAMRAATVRPAGLVVSSAIEGRAGLPAVWRTGASLTGVTVTDAVSVATLKALVPPLVVVSTVVPFVPLVSSQARRVIVALPLKSASGTKRILFEALELRAR